MTALEAPPAAEEAARQLALGNLLTAEGRLGEAEACYRRAIGLDPGSAIAHNNLGWVQQARGDRDAAIAQYRQATELDPDLGLARRNLAVVLVSLGRASEAKGLFRAELAAGPAGLRWMEGLVTSAMHQRDLTRAGDYARILAEQRWSSPTHALNFETEGPPLQPADRYLSAPKLRHDIEQFEYLRSRRILGREFGSVIKKYRAIADRLEDRGIVDRIPLDEEAEAAIGDMYSRLIHRRASPRTAGRLWGHWDPATVEQEYLNKPLGLVVVDDFLSAEVLEELRLFCMESTIWFANRYGHGRLGAFFNDGFNSPLLLQIAEGLREAFPRVIVDRYPLRQLWAFKNGEYLPGGSTTHADFAAVNVNFWITPAEANLDPQSGGLLVYDVDAPPSWDFVMYNGRQDLIEQYLRQQNARPVVIPYRANRAIIFNSDLFHASAGLRFRPGYENRRVNITMLFGDRENDEHHANVGHELGQSASLMQSAWRSSAFSRARRRAD